MTTERVTQSINGRRPQFPNQPQDVGEQVSRNGDLSHLERDIGAQWPTTFAPNDVEGDSNSDIEKRRSRETAGRLWYQLVKVVDLSSPRNRQ